MGSFLDLAKAEGEGTCHFFKAAVPDWNVYYMRIKKKKRYKNASNHQKWKFNLFQVKLL